MAYQSLYRRYRPQKFAEVRGQDHLVRALTHAVADDRVGHAYLFSGPRGTGKTTTARILAKALNCPDLSDGEPCGVCASCEAIEHGTSFDLQELDAASNRGINEMRSLLENVALGTPGRTKVYILDEVHMLTKEASAALLKTLEEPPEHVVFVLATTDPQKVLPTIRSRCQHFELHLLPSDDLSRLLTDVAADAGLDVSADQLEYALRKGGGSARDTLSVLDQVASAGSAPEGLDTIEQLLDGITAGDAGATLTGVQQAVSAGREPRVIGETLLEELRDAFLLTMRVELPNRSEAAAERARSIGETMGPRPITRALELLGEALVDMRQAADPRIPLEVALLRITRPEADLDVTALAARLDRLERRLDGGAASPPSPVLAAGTRPAPGADASDAAPRPAAAADASEAAGGASPAGAVGATQPSGRAGPASAARQVLAGTGDSGRQSALGAHRAGPPSERPSTRRPTDATGSAPNPEPGDAAATVPAPAAVAEPEGSESAPAPPSPSSGGATAAGDLPSRDELTLAWGDVVLGSLTPRARTRWAPGRFLDVDAGVAAFGLPNKVTCDRCEEQRPEVEQALAAHFGRAVPVRLVVDDKSTPPPDSLDVPSRPVADHASAETIDDVGPIHELEDAVDTTSSGLSKLEQAFPGAELIEVEGDT